MQKWITLIVCLALPMVVGLTSGFLTSSESGGPWFKALQKPSFNPPSWVFGPVWTTLYLLMGVSLFLVYRSPHTSLRQTALIIFGVQLVLNFFWSLIFFRYHQLGLASVEIVLMLGAIIAMVVVFYKINPVAAYLQIPYIAWVSFATVLCVSIYWLNRAMG